jgi:tripartite-type tricarboxylate transporter receptor subunit TctC
VNRLSGRFALVAALVAAMTHGVHAAEPQPSSANAGEASVQTYPSKPIRILVGFTPGGAPDITARVIAQKLSESWKQQVVVENRPGAGGTIAAQIVASASPDGYTLLSASNAHAVAAAIYAKLPYDTLKDFTGVTLTSSAPALLLVSPSLGVKSARELIALAKAKPGQLNYSSAGVGSGVHFGTELFNSMAGIDVVHIPFKGVPEAVTETMTGRVQFMLSPLGAAMNIVKQGRIPVIGVSGTKRFSQLPDVPTIAESGLPGFSMFNWSGLVAPAQTPRPIIAKLNQELRRILSEPDVRSRWAQLGAEAGATTPAEFDKLIADEIAAFIKIARASNIKAD